MYALRSDRVVVDGQVRPADMIYLSISGDHRVLDGVIAASFWNAVIRRLQKPGGLLL